MLVRVQDFRPYIFFEFPSHVPSFQRELSEHLRTPITRLTFKSVWRRNMYGWVPDSMDHPTARKKHRYLKVSFPTISMMKRAARFTKYFPHEDKVAPETKFLDDMGLTPSGWVSVDGTPIAEDQRIFHGGNKSVEVSCGKQMLQPIDQPDIAPLLVAFVDIECGVLDL